jgi:hypothetical protein
MSNPKPAMIVATELLKPRVNGRSSFTVAEYIFPLRRVSVPRISSRLVLGAS